jgi:hypothetical protein
MRGTFRKAVDHGTIVSVEIFSPEHGGFIIAAGDGNPTRRALTELNLEPGDEIEFAMSDWGGLEGLGRADQSDPFPDGCSDIWGR